MSAQGPGRDPDIDEEFARIVAGWDEVSPTSGSAMLPPHHPDAAAEPAQAGGPGAAGIGPEAPPDPDSPPHPFPVAAPEPSLPDQAAGPRATDMVADQPPGEDVAADDTVPGAQPEPWRGYLPEEVSEDHFEPPEPQLPPAHDATYWLAVLGMVSGPLLVLWAVVLSADPDPGWMVVIGLLLLAAGFGLLVMRGSGQRDPDDDGSRV